MTGLWSDAEEVARTAAPAGEWRSALASSIRRAADASFVSIVTCVPDDWSRLNHDSDPIDMRYLIDKIAAEFRPRIERAGEGWEDALARHGRVYAPIAAARSKRLAGEMHEAILKPVDIEGFVVSFLGTGKSMLGMILLGAPDRLEKVQSRTNQLAMINSLASETLTSAIALATACGAATPKIASHGEILTARERQIAGLAGDGFSNLNIAAQLGISDTTVSVHLRSIYAKLEVHSRVELSAALRS